MCVILSAHSVGCRSKAYTEADLAPGLQAWGGARGTLISV
jgi:hypothetical protein